MATNNKKHDGPLEDAVKALLRTHPNTAFTSVEIRDILAPVIEAEVNDIARIMYDYGYRLGYDIERHLVWNCGDL